jgi:nicotinamide riboside transporter PnuC
MGSMEIALRRYGDHLFLFTMALAALYKLPSFIAFQRNHKNRIPLLVINFFFGWSFIGWPAWRAHWHRKTSHSVRFKSAEERKFDRLNLVSDKEKRRNGS